MKVEIVEKTDIWEFQKALNEKLKGIDDSRIFDIKYTGSGCHSTYGTDIYSAMIIYEG